MARVVRFGNGVPEVLVEQQSDTDSNIETLLADLRGDEGGRVIVQRRRADGSGVAYLSSLPALDFSVDKLIDTYGGGKYYLKFVGSGGVYKGSAPVEVDESIPHRVPSTAIATTTPGAAPAVVVGSANPLESIVARLMDRLERLAERPEIQAKPAMTEGMEIAKTILDMVKTVLPAGGGGAPAQGTTLKDQISMIKDIKELVEDFGGGGGGGDPQSELVKGAFKLGEPIVDMLKDAYAEKRAARGLLPPPAGSGAPVESRMTVNTPSAAPEGAPPVKAEGWMMELAQWVPGITNEAKNDTNPESLASFIIDRLSPRTVERLAEMVKQPDAMDTLCKFVPVLKDHPEWAKEFLESIREETTPEEPAPAPGSPPPA